MAQAMWLAAGYMWSNDGLVLLMVAVCLWWLMRLYTGKFTIAGCFLWGVLLGAALLSKVHGVLIIALLPGLWWRHRRDGGRLLLAGSVAMGVGAALVCGWWLLRNWLLYRDALALEPTVGLTVRDSVFNYLLWPIPSLWQSFWLDFSRGLAGAAPVWYYTIIAVVIAALLPAYLVVLRRFPSQRVMLLLHGMFVMFIVALSIWQKARMHATGAILLPVAEGRHVFIALPSLTVIAAAALQAVGLRWRVMAGAGLCGAALLALAWNVGPRLEMLYGYSQPPTIPAFDRPRQFANGVQLRGATVSTAFHEGVTGWWVDLQWTTTRHLTASLTVSAQLLALRSGGVDKLAQEDSLPGNGRHPTAFWQPGVVVAERYFLPRQAREGAVLKVGVFLYDNQRGTTIPTVNDGLVLLDLPN